MNKLNEKSSTYHTSLKRSKLAFCSVIFMVLGFFALFVLNKLQQLIYAMGNNSDEIQMLSCKLFFWIIGLLCGIIAILLIKRNKRPMKGLYWASASSVICASAILVTSIPFLLPSNSNFVIPREHTFDGTSSELKNTIIVPALESAIPQNKNVMWCSSFQIAWNELKDTVIQEPIQIENGQQIANLLNNAKQTRHDITAESFYAKAGLVQKNIIQTIQSEMAQKYPSEQVPTFDNINDGDAIVAYSYLTAGVKFEIPYFENDEEFIFTDIHYGRSKVTSFGIRPKDDYAYYRLRNQIQILFFTSDSNFQLTEFALDLCKTSSPNQIVLAAIERKTNFAEMLAYIEEKEKAHPKEKYDRKFGPNDVLLAPNIYWKITHSFSELEGNALKNQAYNGLPIIQAKQVIQFRLDRSGAELKSESKLAAAPIPNYYIFNRPFLIYMKKRGADYPFFVMWVDNTELLEKAASNENP